MNKYLEEKFCFHCAPTLLNRKVSNLVILKNRFFLQEELTEYNIILSKFNISLFTINVTLEYSCILLYNKNFLQEQLGKSEVRIFLQEFGYNSFSIQDSLENLSERFTMRNFPHEIGVFLGYPMEDVKGFIENNGYNYLICGYWKVYKNPEIKKDLFNLYTACRKLLCEKVNSGCPFIDVFKEEMYEDWNYLLVANG